MEKKSIKNYQMTDMAAISSSEDLWATVCQKQESTGRKITVCFYLPHTSPLPILAPDRQE